MQQPALQVILGRERDRVDQDVEAAPLGADGVKHRLELAGPRYVEREEDRSAEGARERLDVGFRLLVQIGDRELRTQLAERVRAPVRDRMLVGDACDERLAAGEWWTGYLDHVY